MTGTKKTRALIADDENHVRRLLKSVVQKMNCEVVGEAKNGQEALDLFKKEKPDLLLLDINMPFKTGDEVLEEIMTEFPDAFVIMLSSIADADSVEKCLELGASNYLRKDTPLTEMKKIIYETWQNFKSGKEQLHG